MILGDFNDTAPAAAKRFAGQAALIHADVGSGDHPASRALAAALVPHWTAMLADGGLIVADQPIQAPGLEPLPLPEGAPGRYFISRRVKR
jgi:hypothetical protein